MKYVRAEAAKGAIGRVCFGLVLDEETEKALTDAIDETQAEDVKKNVYGEWEYHSNPDCGIDPEDAFCSMCGFYIDRTTVDNFDNYNFCPRCGADMRKMTLKNSNIENFKTITSCISVICISRKNKHYFVNVPGTAIYLRAVSDPVKAIMDIGAVPANEPKLLNRFKRVIKEAEKAKEEANYIGEFKIDSERTLCIFTDKYGEAWEFDKKFFKDFELITDNYKLFYPLPFFNRDKALAGFKDGVLIGLIMPVRFTTDHERKKVNEFVKKNRAGNKERNRMKDSLFGKYCYIDTPWIAGKKTVYRILASGVESNSYCDVPVNGKTKPKWHRHFEQIVYVVLDTLVSDRSEILRFALKDVEIIDDESEKRGQGKWEKVPSFLPNYQYIVCSVCGMEALQDENGAVPSNFCPNCGADMRGDTE